jgi:hypothetical protein
MQFLLTVNPHESSDIEQAARLFLTQGNKDLLSELTKDNSAEIPLDVEAAIQGDYLDINLILTAMHKNMADHSQIVSYLGDVFSAHFYGKSPLVLNLNFTILDSWEPGTYSTDKYIFMWLFTNLFGITGVARYGVTPCLQVENNTYYIAFLDANVVETSEKERAIKVTTKALVFNYISISSTNDSGINSLKVLYDEATLPEIHRDI